MNGFSFAIALPALLPLQATRRALTAEDLYRIADVREARLSPDGSKVLYVVLRAVKERNTYDADLYVVPTTAGGEARRLTTSEASDDSPRWSPDGRSIAFVSKRSGTAQVWVLPIDGGEARMLTDIPGGASRPVWAPDGPPRIAFLGKVGGKKPREAKPPEEGEARKPGEGPRVETEDDPHGHEFAQDVRVIERAVYRKGTEYLDGGRTHLFVVTVGGGESQQITSGDFDVRQHAWSPDGSRLAFVANRKGDPDLDRNDDVWIVPAAGGEPHPLTPNEGPDHSPTWSADGKWIAYVGNADVRDLKTPDDLWVVPPDGGEARNLTAAFDRIPTDPGFAPDGASVLFRAADLGNVHLFSVPLAGGEVRRLLGGDRWISDFTVSRDGATVAFVASDPMNPPDVYLASRDGTGERRLTETNREFLSAVALAKPEEIRAKSFDGKEVHGWVLRPPHPDPSRKHPCVLYVHGGPYWHYGNVFFHEFQYLAARGFVVLYTNPRLSTGYGEPWTRAGEGKWGEPVLKDLLAAVDHLVSLGYVDGERLGIAGGSFGGYMSAWAIGHTDRFKAAVVDRCVSDLLSFWGTSDVPWLVENEFGGFPWDNLDRLRSESPLTWLGNATTPTLLIAGEADYRTPISQTEEVFRALRRRGVPARMVRYPREGHELSRSGEPVHRVDRLNRIADWFETYLMPGRTAAPAETAPVQPASDPTGR